jgi:transcription elongation factor GreA-like protein
VIIRFLKDLIQKHVPCGLFLNLSNIIKNAVRQNILSFLAGVCIAHLEIIPKTSDSSIAQINPIEF